MSDEVRQDIWEDHRRQWSHCLRCSLADIRLQHRPEEGVQATTVPLLSKNRGEGLPAPSCPLLVMYPCPDVKQERTGHVWGSRDVTGAPTSPSHGLVEWSWGALGESILPFPIDDVAFSYGLGCRPTSFADPRKLMKAKQEHTKGCRARWQLEMLLVDPDLVLLCGRHALAAVRPDLATQHARLIGEIVPIHFHTELGPAEYEGYVTTSPEEVVINAREDQYDIAEWDIQPETSHVDNPVRHWLWHLLFACWVAATARAAEEGRPVSVTWRQLVMEQARFYGTRTTVLTLLERQEELLTTIASRARAERAWQGVRTRPQEDE